MIDGYEGRPTKAALQMLVLTFTRPGELRQAMWSEFDIDGALWAIPAARTKMRKEHLVPLSGQLCCACPPAPANVQET